ncbi:MAG TPA: STAS domain-containing protein [Puia sp.]|nr:STAS domain-containing protein [Puia sp.]
MKVKIDTRAKFHVITINELELAANMTADLDSRLLALMQNDVKNLVLNLKDIKTMDIAAAEHLVSLQQNHYEQNASFVVCSLQKPVEQFLEQADLLELMNAVPTESEATDLVIMEEIERDLLDED